MKVTVIWDVTHLLPVLHPVLNGSLQMMEWEKFLLFHHLFIHFCLSRKMTLMWVLPTDVGSRIADQNVGFADETQR